jgi:hypothetical protein
MWLASSFYTVLSLMLVPFENVDRRIVEEIVKLNAIFVTSRVQKGLLSQDDGVQQGWPNSTRWRVT